MFSPSPSLHDEESRTRTRRKGRQLRLTIKQRVRLVLEFKTMKDEILIVYTREKRKRMEKSSGTQSSGKAGQLIFGVLFNLPFPCPAFVSTPPSNHEQALPAAKGPLKIQARTSECLMLTRGSGAGQRHHGLMGSNNLGA